MAQAKTIEDAVNELMKDYQKAAIEAASYATKQVMKNFTDKAYDELKKYYDSYHPSSYNRKYYLAECIVPFSEFSISGNTINCKMHIDYDASHLEDLYDYDYGDGKPSRFYRGQAVEGKIVPEDFSPINEFIMNNFLEGIHPTTDGSSKLNAKYKPIYKRHIEHYMDLYVNTLEKDFTDYFMISLLGQLKWR